MASKTIVLTGGGSGGHITPLLAVAAELKHHDPDMRLIYIGQTGDSLGDIPAADPNIDKTYTVRAGKFRRYHGEGLRQLLDIPTMLKNLRDAVYVLIGLWQSWRLLRELAPDVIFIKGGFVGVPVGLAAAKLSIPYVTHDSDAIPGLANRIIARWAAVHAVALPKEVYEYPPDKTVTTGIPLPANFELVTPALRKQYRGEIEMPANARLLLISGGGLGSQRINGAVLEAVPHMLREFRDLQVIHIAGRDNESDLRASYEHELTEAERGRVRVYGFLTDLYRYSGAADVIITRAGATSLADYAMQGKACIVVPSPFLTGGHQLKNAEYLAQKQAAVVLDETDLLSDPNRLAKLTSGLLSDDARRQELGRNLAAFAKPHAAQDLAKIILKQIR
jgi:UDP-N-acetylglucosamine--N-acetylmuramyl-(pentapeptide) pyrophosphoryl-undecaprenol N-acetylglucosamine transferase